MSDPRHYQILVLSGLLAYGILALEFGVGFVQLGTALVPALFVQAVATRRLRLSSFDPRSPLITALSLSLLLRVAHPGLLAAASALAIGSKFLVRVQGRHLFNPAAFGIVALLLFGGNAAWVSPGQWGRGLLLAGVVASAGGLVLYRARRSDITLAFLATYALLLAVRSLWLNEPFAIWGHRLQSGALLVFAFFMISDPRTAPVARVGRILFAALVAGVTYVFAYVWYANYGLFYALILCSPLVPVMNRIWPDELYNWAATARNQEEHHDRESPPAAFHPVPDVG